MGLPAGSCLFFFLRGLVVPIKSDSPVFLSPATTLMRMGPVNLAGWGAGEVKSEEEAESESGDSDEKSEDPKEWLLDLLGGGGGLALGLEGWCWGFWFRLPLGLGGLFG